MKILFWNTNDKPVVRLLARAANVYSLDCIVLAEFYNSEQLELTRSLLGKNGYKNISTPGCDKISIFCRNKFQVELHRQDTHYSIFSINGLIIGAVHFPSKLHATSDRLRRISEKTCEAIEAAENSLGHRKSIIVGDFNMNPFDEAMISFTGIRSTNVHSEIEKGLTRDDEKRYLFYNPTWVFYERYRSRPGTYYYRNLGENILNWHIIDQVVIRPSLVPNFSLDEFEILQSIAGRELLNNKGKPQPSDHLPLVFNLKRKDK